ncbi:Uncharacterized membrane protein [Halomicrobium zhouii]|uniref:Uncharacterized membrane protein n=1 Tax=Halomicrobium zhouii TaxID=767519 RepID=A0A1I6M504_9EURY|nr:DUF1616 domain-containing protein [Halomicrobium zhouii]SFS10751.1 Uncharacterized membrane protein [Halomicrobium zhouii]
MTTASSTDSEPGRIRSLLAGFPLDLLAVVVLTALVFAVLLGSDAGYSWPRALVGMVFVLVLPGYALVAALFPGRPTGTRSHPVSASAYSPGTIERFGLSFGFSLALLPILAVIHGLLGIPFETATVVTSVTVLVVALSIVGIVRRFALSPNERYSPPSLLGFGARTRDWLAAGTATDTVLSAVLVVAVLLAVGSLAFGLTGPTQGESYTSVSLVTESSDGDYVASGYPTNLTAGEAHELTLEVENRYEEPADYTAVVELQRVDRNGTDGVAVTERERLQTLASQVPANETWRATHQVEPSMTGEDLRLAYYVYRGEAPETPSAENAEGHVHLWVTVQ